METWFNLLGWLLSILGAVGNSSIVFLVAKNRRLHSPANWLVLSLAVADFWVGVGVFPSGYLCSKTACNMRVYMAFFWFFIHSSVTNLCLLTWDRYTAIVHPFKYITCMTTRRPRLIILVAWLIPLVISLSLFLGMYATTSLIAWKILRLMGASAFDILACLLLLYSVVRILLVARAKAKEDYAIKRIDQPIEPNEQQNQLYPESKALKKRKRTSTALFLTVLLMFFLGCHTATNYLILSIAFFSDVSNAVSGIVTLLLVVNSGVNPLVYAILKKDIKRELKQLINRKRKKKRFTILARYKLRYRDRNIRLQLS